MVDTTEEWIVTRTGMKDGGSRGPTGYVGHGREAARRALATAGSRGPVG
jgi:3-oxoacyl-[acyl-carrier-protein] synthase III